MSYQRVRWDQARGSVSKPPLNPPARGGRKSGRGGGFRKALSDITRKSNKQNNHHKNKHKKNSLSFLQINTKKKKIAWDTLISNIHGINNPIILVTEPYTDNKNTIPHIHKDLIPYYHKHNSTKPRAAILIHKSLDNKCSVIPEFTNKDQTTLKIQHNDKSYIINSTYMDINENIPPPQLTELVNYTDKHKLPLIIGTDTNARHKLWGNKDSNSRGEQLLDFISTTGLSWANKGTSPTFMNSRGHNSIIDLTLTNNKSSDAITGWHVSDIHSNSDHHYIRFNITSKRNTLPKQVRLTKNTDWDLFQEHLKNNLDLSSTDFNSTKDIDIACEKLNDHTVNAFNYACPITYISSSIKKPPWLTPEIQNAQKTIRHKLVQARSSKNESSLRELRDSNRAYNKLLRTTKRTEWKKFCASVESTKEAARMNKIINNLSNNNEKLDNVYKPDNTLTNNPTDTLNTMIDTHFKKDPTPTSDYEITHTTPPKILMDKIYDPARIDKAVNDFEPDKSPGPDGIKPIMLQKAWPVIKDIIRKILIRSHELQHIPTPWTNYKGIFIPKPAKTDYNNTKSFRTITLSPILLKLHERVVQWHMQYDLGMANKLSTKQYGFRRGTSTETALHKVVNIIEHRIAKKGYVLGTFLDIEGAFDNVSFKAISNALHDSPLDQSTIGWIMSMVTNRFITITHKNISRRFKVERGCPQGGILSPFLWNLVVDDLLKSSAKDTPGYLQAFADDLVVLAEGNDTDIIWQRTQHTIKTIEKWCDSKGLNISALKTKTILFTWNKKWSLRPITVGGEIIEPSDNVKFLGVTLDNKLNFNTHIDKITNKAINKLIQCKRAVGSTWGLTPKSCKWIFETVIRPALSYAIVIWIRALNTKRNIRKLERVQSLALRIMTGAMPSTPHHALNYLTNTTNIGCYLKGEAAKGAARLKSYKDWTVTSPPTGKGIIIAHSTISNNFLSNINLNNLDNRDLIKPSLHIDKNFTITFPVQDDIPNYRNLLKTSTTIKPPNSIDCYTDGSKTGDGVGGGFFTIYNDNNEHTNSYMFKLPDYCSVFQAELTALAEGAKSLLDYNNRNITFWTDSLSSLHALKSKLINSKTVTSCHDILSKLAANNTVHIKWVAAHSGHWGNEQADNLAKQGTTSQNHKDGHIPHSLIKQKINEKVNEMNKGIWDSLPHKHTQLILGHKSKEIIKALNTNLPNRRKPYRLAIQLITGHIGLNKHLHTMTISSTDICPRCDLEPETVTHLLTSCPSYSQLRADYFNSYFNNITDITEHFDITHIVNFALKTNRFLNPEDRDQSGVT